MRSVIIKLTAVLLLIAMLIPVAGCADNGDETQDTSVADESAQTEETDPYKSLDNPDVTFDDYEFKVLSADYSEYFTQLDVEKSTGEVVNDAIYDRNRLIEDIYKIKFQCDTDYYDNLLAAVEKQVKSGDGKDAYDLIMLICRNAYTATINNYLIDYSQLEYVNTDKEYYFETLNKQFSIGGKRFFAFGAESVNVLSFANCLIFNNQIAEKHSMPDFYDMVNNKEWTYAKLFEYAEIGTTDLNGDDKIKYGDDIIGLIGDYDKIIPASWVSSGETLITKDADDMPAFTASGNERFINVMQYALDNFAREYCAPFTANDGKNESFINGNAFMFSTQVGALGKIRSMTGDYGLLPWPMYDQAQGQYYSRAEDAWLHCVPNTCTNTDRTSIILQALAYYSYQTVYDAYYTQALSGKYVRNQESVDMLKLILSTMIVDIGDNVWYEYIRMPLVSNITAQKGSTKLASTLKKYEKPAKKQIDKAIKFANGD